MKKQLLLPMFLGVFTITQSHVLDDVMGECRTEFKNLSLNQQIAQHISSIAVGGAAFALTSILHNAAAPKFSNFWFIAHGASAAGVAFLVKNNLIKLYLPEKMAASILAQEPMYGQMLDYLELPTDTFTIKMGEMFASQEDAYNKIVSLKNNILNVINQMNAIPKYSTLQYRPLLQNLRESAHALQKAERAIIKTESWFLEKIHVYAHIYNLIQSYDNEPLIQALTNYYTGSTYPRLALVNDLHQFQNKLRSLNASEYAPQDFLELRKRNLHFIEILQRIILFVENSYEYQAERKIKHQSDEIKALQVKGVVQDIHTIHLYGENRKLRNEPIEKEQAKKYSGKNY